MYGKNSIIKYQDKIISRIEMHQERLKNFQSPLSNTTQDSSNLFGRHTKIQVPELQEVWDKFNIYCAKNWRLTLCTTTSSNHFSTFKSRQMNGEFIEMMNNLTNLSKQVLDRVCKRRMALLDEDECFFKRFCSEKDLPSLREMSEHVALKQLKKAEPLTLMELKILLSITTTFFEKGIVTDYYQQHASPAAAYPKIITQK